MATQKSPLSNSRLLTVGYQLYESRHCCGPLTPDTFLDEDDRHAEVFYEQTTTYFQPCL